MKLRAAVALPVGVVGAGRLGTVAAAALADGVAVGSRPVQVAEDGPDALAAYVASLRAALDAVANGGSVVDPKVVDALISAHVRAEQSPLAGLTERRLKILGEVAQGKSNGPIADELAVGKRVVEKEINVSFRSLGLTRDDDVSRRVKAALIYLSQNLPDEPPRA